MKRAIIANRRISQLPITGRDSRRAVAAKVRETFASIPFIVDVDDSFHNQSERLRLSIDHDSLEYSWSSRSSAHSSCHWILTPIPLTLIGIMLGHWAFAAPFTATSRWKTVSQFSWNCVSPGGNRRRRRILSGSPPRQSKPMSLPSD
ncbi:hypothetical protein [Mesorhizobium sp. M4B.F.Ca.ET.049.02.1.2]|uniref:hypothetical protein n=1 Tax=Mesorhizobium sp. M4B.F.Ca.ET.049.02.1.2 TaxID=2496752 RepID=UPI001FDEB4D2|nr:hypothetical protein [Mesorhizobium sp. M4B.F.Ca.ET.049.02.1.2]